MHQSISSYMISLFCECSLFLLFVKGFWKPFVHPLNLSVLPLQYKGRTHDGSIRLGEHTVFSKASKAPLSPIAQQRKVPGPTQVSLAAGCQELGGVVVGDGRVLDILRYSLMLEELADLAQVWHLTPPQSEAPWAPGLLAASYLRGK